MTTGWTEREVRPIQDRCKHYVHQPQERSLKGRVELVTISDSGELVTRQRMLLCEACCENLTHWMGLRVGAPPEATGA